MGAKTPRVKVLERDVKAVILDWCAAHCVFVQVRNVGAVKIGKRFVRFAKPGQSDLWLIGRGGRHIECELKAPGKLPTQEQRDWLADCTIAGAVSTWADSLEMFIEKVGPYL